MRYQAVTRFGIWALFFVLACKGGETTAPTEAPAASAQETSPAAPDKPSDAPKKAVAATSVPDALPNGLLLAYSQFEVVDGKATAKPGPARLDILTREGGEWKIETVEDAQSNVFHKAMVLTPRGQAPGILTLGGSGAYLKLWRRDKGKLRASTLWHAEFGGKFNRMRDAEVADVYGDGTPAIVVATHDQGVVAILRQRVNKWKVERIDKKKDTFVHEIEIGDLDKDGVLEVYATPSEPNKLDADAQRGEVVRYVPKRGEGPTLVADLGKRHAKEIYVGDVDGDGTDELYVAVEALTRGRGARLELVEPVEIRRYDADTPPDAKVIIATIPDRLCRFLTVGDVDGDGKKEMVAASFSKGLWLLRPGKNPKSEWGVESIDRDSGGFEHAALLTDLDGDGTDELYVAADVQGELRRYVWVRGRAKRQVILKREIPMSRMTWNIMPAAVVDLGR
ncbi:MAG: VCBS repeat-containing protein [Deltaproteobacteria bacterium]|nr:VCBS repeat-containing protein [Deltaproteobacteria bacterium]